MKSLCQKKYDFLFFFLSFFKDFDILRISQVGKIGFLKDFMAKLNLKGKING